MESDKLGIKHLPEGEVIKSYSTTFRMNIKINFFYRLDESGKYIRTNTSNYFNPTINMCGYGVKDRIKHLRTLFRQGKLMIGDLPLKLRRKILIPY